MPRQTEPIIEEYLKTKGKTLQGKPIFRLVWSDDQLETRLGTFNDFAGEIYIRTVTEVREVPKYWYKRERWILEKWNYPSETYEPFWAFENGKQEYMKPTLKVVDFLVCMAQGNHRVMDKTERQTIAEKMRLEEIQAFMDEIDYSPDQDGRADIERMIKNEFIDAEIRQKL